MNWKWAFTSAKAENVGFLGGGVDVVEDRVSNVSVPPANRKSYEVDPPQVRSSLGVYSNVGVSVSRMVLGESRKDEDLVVHN